MTMHAFEVEAVTPAARELRRSWSLWPVLAGVGILCLVGLVSLKPFFTPSAMNADKGQELGRMALVFSENAKCGEVTQGRRLVGEFRPACEPDGTFSPRQCWASTGFCWCVDEAGKKYAESQSRPGPRQEDCEQMRQAVKVRAHAAPRTADCMSSRLAATASLPLVGAFLPSCKADGSFESQQCWASTGMCWCVDASGSEVPGTRARPGPTSEDCEAHLVSGQQCSNEQSLCTAQLQAEGANCIRGYCLTVPNP